MAPTICVKLRAPVRRRESCDLSKCFFNRVQIQRIGGRKEKQPAARFAHGRFSLGIFVEDKGVEDEGSTSDALWHEPLLDAGGKCRVLHSLLESPRSNQRPPLRQPGDQGLRVPDFDNR